MAYQLKVNATNEVKDVNVLEVITDLVHTYPSFSMTTTARMDRVIEILTDKVALANTDSVKEDKPTPSTDNGYKDYTILFNPMVYTCDNGKLTSKRAKNAVNFQYEVVTKKGDVSYRDVWLDKSNDMALGRYIMNVICDGKRKISFGSYLDNDGKGKESKGYILDKYTDTVEWIKETFDNTTESLSDDDVKNGLFYFRIKGSTLREYSNRVKTAHGIQW